MMRNVGALAQPLLLCLKWRVGGIEAHVEEEGTLPLRLSMFLHPCQGLLRKSCSKKGGTNQLLDLGLVDMKLRCSTSLSTCFGYLAKLQLIQSKPELMKKSPNNFTQGIVK